MLMENIFYPILYDFPVDQFPVKEVEHETTSG